MTTQTTLDTNGAFLPLVEAIIAIRSDISESLSAALIKLNQAKDMLKAELPKSTGTDLLDVYGKLDSLDSDLLALSMHVEGFAGFKL